MPRSPKAKARTTPTAAPYSQPAFCAVVGAQCPYPVQVLDGGLTLAYPFRAWMKDWADRLVALRKQNHKSTYAPHKHFSTNYLICDVCKEIRARPIHLSEVSEPNSNVYYEAGFAFGSDKLVMLAEDINKDLARARIVFPEYLRASYRHDEELLAKVEEAMGATALTISRVTATPDPRRLYFVDPGVQSTQILDLKKSLRRSRILQYSAPAGGLARLPTLHAEIYEVKSARAVLGLLLPHDYVNQDVLNARTCFLIGVAVALEKPVLLLAQEPNVFGPADLQMLVQPFASVATMQRIVQQWLGGIGTSSAPSSTTSRRSLLEIDLGNAWAERDPMLDEYFLETAQYRSAREASTTVFLGRRGTGKSAIALSLGREGQSDRSKVFKSIRPEAFEMEELQRAYEKVTARGSPQHWKLVLGAVWRYLLLSQLAWAYLKHFEGVHEEPAELGPLRELVALVPHDEDFVDAVLAVTTYAAEVDNDELRAFMGQLSRQRILAPFISLSRRLPARLVLDNLDVTWDVDNVNGRFVLASLIRESERLNQRFDQSIAVLLFLRSDIYNVVKLADPDIDKQSREHLSWSHDGLVEVIGLRLRYLLDSKGSPSDAWAEVFPHTVQGFAAPDFFISRTLRRPRELIKLCDLAIEYGQARKAKRVSETDVLKAIDDYSEMLLTDIHGEYLVELPDLYYFMLEFSSLDWPLGMDDMRGAVRKAAEREGHAGRKHAWHSESPIDTVIKKLYEVGAIGLAARNDDGTLRTLFSYERDWPVAYGGMRTKLRLGRARRARKETWAEPLVVLHPAFHPVLGAHASRSRGPAIRSRRTPVAPKPGT